jgi:hypothetical protein
MSTRTIKFLFGFTIIALIMACVPSIAAPLPTADPNAVNTFIAQTANAARTRTAAALPTSTLTATITPTRNTETPSPTFTSTVIFILSSPTQPVPPTLSGGGGGNGGGGGGSGGGSSSADYSCQVISVSPSNGTSFNPRDDFDATWRVRNNGTKDWDRNSTDFYYLSGSKIHKVAGYDLSQDVDTGETINLSADMQAPKDSGNYTTTWTLRVGDRTFCNVSLTINVR